jgi:hypothetical protein
VVGQPDAVAEQRTLGERRAGVDREHGHLALALARLLDQAADQRGLADAGRAGEADDRRLSGLRVYLADERPALGVVVLDERDGSGEGSFVAGEQALGELGGGVAGRGHAAGNGTANRAQPAEPAACGTMGGSAHGEHPHPPRHVARLRGRVAPGEVQVRRAAAADQAVAGVAVVGVAVPADPAKRRPRVVLARLGPLGEPGHRAPAAARAGIEVDG